MKIGFKLGQFWNAVITLIVVYGLVKWVVPLVSRKITGLPFPLSVPGTLMIFYMALTLAALFIYISFSEERLQGFLAPIKKLFSGEYGVNTRTVVLAIVPLVVGWQVYSTTVPKVSSPTSLRIQHPSSNFPKTMETLENPLRNPKDAEVEKFIEEVKANKVEFIPEAREDVEKVKDKYENTLGFIPTEPVQTFLKEIKAVGTDLKSVPRENARRALIEKYLFEGRILYAMNCRPCHGDSVSGDGPMADGFKLRPINFTDNGTIETIVEGYTFWRVSNGGPGLPSEATPWDSAMPIWKTDLPEEYRWRILLAEYDLAQKTPRQPEKRD